MCPIQTIEELIAAGQIPVKDDEYIIGVYIDLLNRLMPEVRLILETAVDAAHRPMLFHCAAGKDRTGIVAAVLLGVLGVPDETIIEDYELTTTHYGAHRLVGLAGLLSEHGIAPEEGASPGRRQNASARTGHSASPRGVGELRQLRNHRCRSVRRPPRPPALRAHGIASALMACG